MSGECKKQIRRRQKLMSEDYKISLSLAKACKVKGKKMKYFVIVFEIQPCFNVNETFVGSLRSNKSCWMLKYKRKFEYLLFSQMRIKNRFVSKLKGLEILPLVEEKCLPFDANQFFSLRPRFAKISAAKTPTLWNRFDSPKFFFVLKVTYKWRHIKYFGKSIFLLL